MYLLVAEKWTRQRFEHRTPEMRLRLPLVEVPTMIASEPTDTYMDHDAKYWLVCRMARGLTVQLKQQDLYNEMGRVIMFAHRT